jgi:hypothetical protein
MNSATAFRAFFDRLVLHVLPAFESHATALTLVFVQWHYYKTSLGLRRPRIIVENGRLRKETGPASSRTSDCETKGVGLPTAKGTEPNSDLS